MPLYTSAKQRFFSLMGELGFGSDSVEEEFETRDIKNVALWGFTVERFRRSMVETYNEFCKGTKSLQRSESSSESHELRRQWCGTRPVRCPERVKPCLLSMDAVASLF